MWGTVWRWADRWRVYVLWLWGAEGATTLKGAGLAQGQGMCADICILTGGPMGAHNVSTKKSQKEADTQFLLPFPTQFDDSFPCPWGVPMWTGEHLDRKSVV